MKTFIQHARAKDKDQHAWDTHHKALDGGFEGVKWGFAHSDKIKPGLIRSKVYPIGATPETIASGRHKAQVTVWTSYEPSSGRILKHDHIGARSMRQGKTGHLVNDR